MSDENISFAGCVGPGFEDPDAEIPTPKDIKNAIEIGRLRRALRLIAYARDPLGRKLHELLPERDERKVLMAIEGVEDLYDDD